MFGKGKMKSSNAMFVTAAGVKAGNLKGRGKSDKTAPFAKKSSLSLPTYRNITQSMGPSKGKAGPVKIT